MSKNQIKHKTLFKNILTTSAIVAVGMVPASSAWGALHDVGAGAVSFSGAGAIVGWNTNDSLSYDDDDGVVTFNQPHTVTSIGIEDGITPGKASVIAADVTIGAVSNDDTSAKAGGALDLDFSGDHTLTLSGVGAAGVHTTAIKASDATTYDKLGTINFQGNKGNVSVTASGVTLGAIDTTTDSTGTITVTGKNNTIGAIGATKSIASLSDQSSNGTTTTYSGVVNAASITTAAGAVDFQDAVTGNVTTGAGAVSFSGATKGNVELNNNASVVNFAGGGSLTGNITTATDTKGVINITDDVTITGNIGSGTAGVNQVNISSDKTLTMNGSIFESVDGVHNTTITLADDAMTSTTLSVGANDANIAHIVPASANHGVVNVDAERVVFSQIGEGVKGIGDFNLLAKRSAIVSNASVFGDISLREDSTLTYRGANITMAGTIEGKSAADRGTLVITNGNVLGSINPIGAGNSLNNVTLGEAASGLVTGTTAMGTLAAPKGFTSAVHATTLHLVSGGLYDSTGGKTPHILMDSKLDAVGNITADSHSRLVVAADYESKANIGTAAAPVNVVFTDKATRNLDTRADALGTYYVNATSTNGRGVMRVSVDDSEVHGTIGSATAGNNLEYLVFMANGKFSGTSYAPITMDDGNSMTVSGKNTVFHGTVNSSGGHYNGQIVIDDNITGVQFKEVIGGTHEISKLTLNDGSSATIDADANIGTGGVAGAINFGNGSTLTINSGKNLTLTNSTINGTGAGRGTLVLNGQTIAATIGAANTLANIEVNGETTLSSEAKAAAITFGSNEAKLNVNAFTVGTLALANNATGTKLSLASGKNGTVNGDVAAIGELHFMNNAGADDTLTVTGKFNAEKVTSATDIKGTLHVKSNGAGRTISSDFGDINKANKRLSTLHLENTDGATATTFTLTGSVASDILTFTKANANDTLRIGNTVQAPGDAAIRPAAFSTKIRTNDANSTILVDGHAAVIGSIGKAATGGAGAEFNAIKFNDDSSRLYVSNGAGFAINSPMNFAGKKAELIVFGDTNLTVNKNISTGGAAKGSIRAYGTTEAQALANRAAGVEFLGASPANSTKSITIDAEVGTNAESLALLDANGGNVIFTDTGATNNYVAIDTVNADTVTLTGDRKYRFKDMNANSLVFKGDSTINAGSTFLGSLDNPLSATAEFDHGAARTITIDSGVNINLSNAIEGKGGANSHNLQFEGEHTIYSDLGTSAAPFAQLKLANGKAATFKGNLYTADLNLNHADSRANAYKDISGTVTASANNRGTLALEGSADQSINKIANTGGHHLNTVEVAGASNRTITVTEDFAANDLTFYSDSTLKLDGAFDVTGDVQVFGGKSGIITLAKNSTLKANIANKGPGSLKELQIGSTTLQVANNQVLNTTVTGSGTLQFNGASVSENLDVGTASQSLADVKFDNGGVVSKLRDVFATNITIDNNTVTMRNARGITNVAGGGTTIISNNGYISAKGAGTVTFEGNATIAKAGEAGSALVALNITQPKGSVVTLSGTDEIHSTLTTHTNGTFEADSLTVKGKYAMTNATLKLNSKSKPQLTVEDDFTLSGDVNINAYQVSDKPTIDASGAGVAFDFAALSNMDVNLTPVGDFTDGAVVINARAGEDLTALANKVKLKSNNKFRTISSKADGNTLTMQVTDNTDKFLSETISDSTMRSSLKSLVGDNVELMMALGNDPKAEDTVKRYTNFESTAGVRAGTVQAHNFVASQISHRFQNASSFARPIEARADSLAQGIAAGSPSEKFGAWVEVSIGKGRQAVRKGDSGYSSRMDADIVGVDTMLNDKFMAGLALGNVDSDLKYKNTKSGDKVKSSSWMFTGYGSYNMSNDYFIRGSMVASSNKVHSKELRGGGTVEGKYTVESYSIEGTVGKNFNVVGGVLSPSIGLRGYYVSSINYNESGVVGLNRSVKQNSKTSAVLTAGAGYSTEAKVGDYLLNPEVHANLQYDVGSVKNDGQFKPVSGTKYQKFVGTKTSRFNGRIGASVTSYINNIEYGVGYDVDISDRYLGHEGTLKMKVNF